jgi:hypothetical protein
MQLQPIGLSVGNSPNPYGSNGQVLTRLSASDNIYGWATPGSISTSDLEKVLTAGNSVGIADGINMNSKPITSASSIGTGTLTVSGDTGPSPYNQPLIEIRNDVSDTQLVLTSEKLYLGK